MRPTELQTSLYQCSHLVMNNIENTYMPEPEVKFLPLGAPMKPPPLPKESLPVEPDHEHVEPPDEPRFTLLLMRNTRKQSALLMPRSTCKLICVPAVTDVTNGLAVTAAALDRAGAAAGVAGESGAAAGRALRGLVTLRG